ncbi:MAG: YraN family protein [Clostridiales Family XIII bacterium]|jgi:putative endonuclease|nr:YraN family protein [Clostridiales Family XIII bacterium]
MKEKLGDWGERRAARYLVDNGAWVIETNFTCKAGEIDIIAEDDGAIAFIEVKTRAELENGLPCESVNLSKRRRIAKAASLYIAQDRSGMMQAPDMDFRFDVIEILIMNKKVWIRHIKDAFCENDC